ncbi:MAG: hypothetical protein MZV49_07080 [Rhodopseudomonas palustris]|nr:hypothetical protein [Rhodopseudomonas palustris]
MVNAGFATTRGINPGDPIRVILQRPRGDVFRIVGIVRSAGIHLRRASG